MLSRFETQAQAVQALFNEMDQDVSEFQLASGLRCASGCNACCKSPTVEATVVEMLPAAWAALQVSEAEAWLERLDAKTDALCIFYDPKRDHGACTRYATRPALCRLFGFSAARNKIGEADYAACKVIKDVAGEAFHNARQGIAAGRLTPPVFSDYGMRLRQESGALGETALSINEAFRKALELMLLYRRFEGPAPEEMDEPLMA